MKNVIKSMIKWIVRGAIYWWCRIYYKAEIIGLENIPKEGSLIFCGNHRTYLDPPLIIVTAGRHVRFIAKEELKKNPLFAILGVLFEGIFVKRDAKDISAMKEAIKTLKNEGAIGIFPEGTRNGFEKNDGKVKNGASYMALKTGAKVIPIAVVGKSKPFTKNAIIYGKPIDFSEYAKDKKIEKEVEDKVSEIIKEEILKLANTEI